MATSEERLKILKLIQSGEITSQQGITLLQVLDSSVSETPSAAIGDGGNVPENPVNSSQITSRDSTQPDSPQAAPDKPISTGSAAADPGPGEPVSAKSGTTTRTKGLDPERWKIWWQLPLGFGVLITTLGAVAMYYAVRDGEVSLWIIPAAVLFLLGIGLTVSAVQMHSSPWLHVRVRQAAGKKPADFQVGIPVPFGLGRWVLRLARPWLGGARAAAAADMLHALENMPPDSDSMQIHVDGDEGEQVDIWLAR